MEANLFRLKKRKCSNQRQIIRDIGKLYQHEKEDYYKPVRVGSF